ncbi:MAG: arsenosugar biosynthesis radical SAM protein ArsS [Desulfobulbaceae bacterium]|nr:arsenosugar biosynthesis radical SAM protein ArsS [Desulfobulbaceae bacterium]
MTAILPGRWPAFSETLASQGLVLRRTQVQTLQVNVGRLCNLACRHCHLEAGPARTEIMTKETMAQVIDCAGRLSFPSIDITGGAPEMNPHLLELLEGLAPHTPRLILRSNLVAMQGNARLALLELCRRLRVVIVASFPAVNESQSESQRGDGNFQASIAMLKRLNDLGWGREESGLELDLVSNPTGAFVPSAQQAQEARFRQVLLQKWGIVFTHLFSFANVPLGRFRRWLLNSGNYDDYMATLSKSFNPCALDGVMCRSLLSVAWDGTLFDCDFNQALDLPMAGCRRHIKDLTALPEAGSLIALSDHCYACTAGAGFT